MKTKTLFTLALTVALIITLLSTHPGKAIAPTASWFGTYGMRNYASQQQGYVYASTLSFQSSQVGYYTLSGNTFVGQASGLTNISGTCFIMANINIPLSATLKVDNTWLVPLFENVAAADQSVVAFNIAVVGQTFEIKISTTAPIGCDILLENKQ